MPLIQLIIGSTRPGRFADKPVAWLVDRLSRRDDFDLEILDLRDHPLAFYDHAVPPARAQRDYPSEDVARFGRAIDRADGFIIVTSEYNHGDPASLKNAMDHVFPEFNRKPVTFVGYGNVGGARAIEQMRLVCVEFEMAPLRHAVHILPELMIAARQADPFFPSCLPHWTNASRQRSRISSGGPQPWPPGALLRPLSEAPPSGPVRSFRQAGPSRSRAAGL
jgi:NAD(P)H-dependent FMN reductase